MKNSKGKSLNRVTMQFINDLYTQFPAIKTDMLL
jgi:hypothetical protein